MEDTISDPGTFVSIDNFLVSPAVSRDSMAGGSETLSQQDPDLTVDSTTSAINTGANSTYGIPAGHRSSFMWRMSGQDGETEVRRNTALHTSDIPRDSVAQPSESSDTEHDEENEDFTDASDLCVNFEDSPSALALPLQPTSSAVHTTEGENNAAYDVEVDSAAAQTPNARSTVSAEHSEIEGAVIHDATNVDDADVTETPQQSTDNCDNDTVANSVTKQGKPHDSQEDDRLQAAAEGLMSFRAMNPFAENRFEEDKDFVLFSAAGPFTAEESSAFEMMAADPEVPEYHVAAKLVETVVFMDHQIRRFKDTAEELNDDILLSERSRSSEVHRQNSHTINVLIKELDAERQRSSAAVDENSLLVEKLRAAETQIESVNSYCRQFNSAFSLGDDVSSALGSIFMQVTDEKILSPERVNSQSEGQEESSKRAIELDQLLSRSRHSLEEARNENIALRSRINTLEEAACPSMQESPELSHRDAASPSTVPDQSHLLLQQLAEQEEQLASLRAAFRKARDDKEQVHEALLSLNLELQVARRDVSHLRRERDVAERNAIEAEQLRSKDRETYHAMSKELSENIISAVKEIEAKDSEIRLLSIELDDRDSVIHSLQLSLSEREKQLEDLTASVIENRMPIRPEGTEDSSGVANVIGNVVKNLQFDLSKAQDLLAERSGELQGLRKKVISSDELLVALRRDCDKYRAVIDAKAITSHLHDTLGSSLTRQEEQHQSFLRRLSSKLGCSSGKSVDMVGKLVSRVGELQAERSKLEDNAMELKKKLEERERAVHVVRSEMQVELSSLKAEVQHLQNLNSVVKEDCETAERRLLEVLDNKDLTYGDSIGNTTASSFNTRRLTGETVGRRESFLSGIGSDDTVRWNDPLVVEAIQSLDALIDMKDTLAARFRSLRERLDSMLKSAESGDSQAGDTRAAMSEARELQADLAEIVGVQQAVVSRLRDNQGLGNAAVATGGDETLPYIQSESLLDNSGSLASSLHGQAEQETAVGHSRNVTRRSSFVYQEAASEAAAFLREQLHRTRDLCDEKSRINAELCAAVSELQHDLEHVVSEKRNMEELLSQVSDSHQSFVIRLSNLTGTDPSIVAIEDYVREGVLNVTRLTNEVSGKEEMCLSTKSALVRVTVQRNFFAHLIDTYQTKYQLDILQPAPDSEAPSARRQFRVRCHALIASLKFAKLSRARGAAVPELDVSNFSIPGLAPIARARRPGIPLMNAAVAIAAVPRLESALSDRAKKIEGLEASIFALKEAPLREVSNVLRETHESSFVYNDDLMDRKQQMARRLKTLLKEKTEVELRFSKEKEDRMAAEARVARYSDKLSVAKKRLGKEKAQTEARERTYRAAIKHLKRKMDRAMENDNCLDENVDPWGEEGVRKPKGTGVQDSKTALREENARSPQAASNSLAILQEQLEGAQAQLRGAAVGSAEAEELKDYVRGLQDAVRHVRRSRLSASHEPSVLSRNIATNGI